MYLRYFILTYKLTLNWLQQLLSPQSRRRKKIGACLHIPAKYQRKVVRFHKIKVEWKLCLDAPGILPK